MIQPVGIDSGGLLDAVFAPLAQGMIDEKNAKADYGDLYKSDPKTALAQEKAKRELDESLHVVASDADKKNPNDVTAAEKALYLGKFVDIQKDKTDIKFDAKSEPDKFKANAMNDIKAMMQTKSGRELIMKLADNTVDTVDANGKVIKKGTKHHTTTLSDTAPKGAPPAGQDQASTTPEYSALTHDNKGGSNTTIAYTAGYPLNQPAEEQWAKDARSDVVLYHEMVHALNDTQGTQLTGKITAANAKSSGDIGEKESEYQALGYLKNPLDVGEDLYRKERKELTGTKAEIKNKYHPNQADATMPGRPKYHMTPAKP
jgi:hypothetical protein